MRLFIRQLKHDLPNDVIISSYYQLLETMSSGKLPKKILGGEGNNK
jgi:hypothetical protein